MPLSVFIFQRIHRRVSGTYGLERALPGRGKQAVDLLDVALAFAVGVMPWRLHVMSCKDSSALWSRGVELLAEELSTVDGI